jgi:hypothetical protein
MYGVSLVEHVACDQNNCFRKNRRDFVTKVRRRLGHNIKMYIKEL